MKSIDEDGLSRSRRDEGDRVRKRSVSAANRATHRSSIANPPKTLTSSKLIFFTSPNPKSLKFNPNRSQIKSMFTEIVEEVGRVKKLGHCKSGRFDLQIHANTILDDVKLGDSISVNGTCLTVTEFDVESSDFMVGLPPETL
ncbi:hypothetical protein V2J09_021900 [Rumex salicifolius]